MEAGYTDTLQSILETIVAGNGDQYFAPEYLEYRTAIVQYIDKTGVRIFSSPTDEDIENFSQYFNQEQQRYNFGQTNPFLMSPSSCVTRTNNNWPTKSWAYPSNSGSSWYYGNNLGHPDCDIYVKYYTGGSTWSHLHATTSDGACVLGKFSSFAAYMSRNFNHVQYGENRVTWWWPVGCNTTAFAVMVGTRLGP